MDSSLSRKRVPIRALVTKLTRRAETVIASGDVSAVAGIFSTLDDKLNQLTVLDKEIFDNWDSEKDQDGSAMEAEVEQGMNYEVSANTCISKLKLFLDQQTTSSRMTFQPVKLPKMELPKFGGSRIQWQSFWQIFEASIHNNSNLADVQKFTYLIGCLNRC